MERLQFRIRERSIIVNPGALREICSFFDSLEETKIKWGKMTKKVIKEQSENSDVICRNEDIWKNIFIRYKRQPIQNIKLYYDILWRDVETMEENGEINQGEYIDFAFRFKVIREKMIELKEILDEASGWRIDDVSDIGMILSLLNVERIVMEDSSDEGETDEEDEEEST